MPKKSASVGSRLRPCLGQGAGEKADLFEHPAGRMPIMQNMQIDQIPACPQNIFIAC